MFFLSTIRHAAFAFGALSLLLSAASLARADAARYPEKPVHIVIGQAAGGAVDTVARALAEDLGKVLGHTMVVENKPGAGGMLAAETVANAPKDGYTLGLLDAGAMVVNPILQKKIRYDVSKDFSYLGPVARIPLALVGHPSVPATNLAELTRLLKSRPSDFNYASAGVGSPPHITFESYKQQAGVNIVHAPYRGGAPALADVVAGHVPLTVIDTNLASQYLKDGRIKVYAVATGERSALLPQVPTFAELGYAAADFEPWVGLIAPAGTDSAIVHKLDAALHQVVASAGFRARMQNIGFVPMSGDATSFSALVQSDLKRYGDLIRAQGIRLDNDAR